MKLEDAFKATLAALMLCSATAAHAQARPAVVELFTSEGCSSCPPAEAYLGELASQGNVLALAFHVDYWDNLGWKDRYALGTATRRQETYAQALGHSSVYTPQVVIDGKSDYVGTDRKNIAKALAVTRAGVPIAITLQAGQINVQLDPSGSAASSDVILVSYLRSAVTPVGRGENAGRTLQEFNLVRSIEPLGKWDGHAKTYQLTASALPRDATDIAVLVQDAGLHVVGAATRSLQSVPPQAGGP
jgi:hypothetical protein